MFFFTSYMTAQDLRPDFRKAMEISDGAFVITKDGQRHAGKSLKISLNYPAMGRDFVKLDGKKIKINDVKAFQDDSGYELLVDEGKKIFAPRFRKGKMNVYINTQLYMAPYSNRTSSSFYLEKDSGTVIFCSYENLASLIGDNPTVLNNLKKYFPGNRFPLMVTGKADYKRMTELFDLYNE